jgi:hypothetical protein
MVKRLTNLYSAANMAGKSTSGAPSTQDFIFTIAKHFNGDPAKLAVNPNNSSASSIARILVADKGPSASTTRPTKPASDLSKTPPAMLINPRKPDHAWSRQSCKDDGCESCCGCAMSQAQCDTCERDNILNTTHKGSAEQQAAILTTDLEVIKPIDDDGCIEKDMVVIGNDDLASVFNDEYVDEQGAKVGLPKTAVDMITGLKRAKLLKYFQGFKEA